MVTYRDRNRVGTSPRHGSLAASAPAGAINDHVGPNNPVRLIEEFVEGFDLQAIRFARVRARTMGRPSYGPPDLAVETKDNLLAEQKSVNQVVDLGLLAPTVTAAMETLGVETNKTMADRGYFSFENMPVAISATGTTTII